MDICYSESVCLAVGDKDASEKSLQSKIDDWSKEVEETL